MGEASRHSPRTGQAQTIREGGGGKRRRRVDMYLPHSSIIEVVGNGFGPHILNPNTGQQLTLIISHLHHKCMWTMTVVINYQVSNNHPHLCRISLRHRDVEVEL
jgi:hypothetical protein